MKKLLLLAIILCSLSQLSAQNKGANSLSVLNYADEMPEPVVSINKYLSENIVYPIDAQTANIEGKVVVKFIVNEEGNITGATVVRSVYRSLDSTALKVISAMPRWKPGRQNGKPVKVYFTLPIVFKLEDKPVTPLDLVYTHVDQMPAPTTNIEEFLRKNLKYPLDARNAHIQGTVDIIYVVNEKGMVSNAVVDRSVYGSLDTEALRLTKILPYFLPGMKDGKPVKVYYKLSVVFDIKNDSTLKSTDSVFTNVEEMPSPTFDIDKYLSMNMVYPIKDLIANIEGKVVVGFIVNEDGSISNVVKIVSSATATQAMNYEAMRAVLEMPHWNPGKINGKPVKVHSILPIRFSSKDKFHHGHHLAY